MDYKYTAVETTRLEQLIKAENDACMLKAIIATAYKGYETIDRGTLKVLYRMFIGEMEGDDE